jgi:hypothetical protein
VVGVVEKTLEFRHGKSWGRGRNNTSLRPAWSTSKTLSQNKNKQTNKKIETQKEWQDCRVLVSLLSSLMALSLEPIFSGFQLSNFLMWQLNLIISQIPFFHNMTWNYAYIAIYIRQEWEIFLCHYLIMYGWHITI